MSGRGNVRSLEGLILSLEPCEIRFVGFFWDVFGVRCECEG